MKNVNQEKLELPFIESLQLVMANHCKSGAKKGFVTYHDLLFLKYPIEMALKNEFGDEIPPVVVKTSFDDEQEQQRTAKTVKYYDVVACNTYMNRGEPEIIMPPKDFVQEKYGELVDEKAKTPGAGIYTSIIKEGRNVLVGDNYEELLGDHPEALEEGYDLQEYRFFVFNNLRKNPKTGKKEDIYNIDAVYNSAIRSLVDAVAKANPNLNRARIAKAIAEGVEQFEAFGFLDKNYDFTKMMVEEAAKERNARNENLNREPEKGK